MNERPNAIDNSPSEVKARLAGMSRRGFAGAGLSVLAAVGGLKWLGSQPLDDGIAWPLRSIFELNERLWMANGQGQLAREFSTKLAREPKVNGDIGLNLGRQRLGELPPDPIVVRIEGPAGLLVKSFGPRDFARLPRVASTTELKCVEGWSAIVEWSGYRFADFAQLLGLSTKYVALETPGGGYYVGLDSVAAWHPRTLLCDTMNGQPLNRSHGGPLRLVIPTKYGVKSLKNIGKIRFTENRPRDFWAEQGYDWYLGL